MVAEAHTLYDRAVADVEAGDDASGKNGRNSSVTDALFQSALPLTAAATPRRGERGEIGGVADAAGGLPREVREAREAVAVQIEIGTRERPVARDVGAQYMAHVTYCMARARPRA